MAYANTLYQAIDKIINKLTQVGFKTVTTGDEKDFDQIKRDVEYPQAHIIMPRGTINEHTTTLSFVLVVRDKLDRWETAEYPQYGNDNALDIYQDLTMRFTTAFKSLDHRYLNTYDSIAVGFQLEYNANVDFIKDTEPELLAGLVVDFNITMPNMEDDCLPDISGLVPTRPQNWGTSGTSGTSGIDGTSGINGANGTSGTSGINGANGTSGTDGINGANGTSGTDGINGANGTSGTDGINGANGTSGTDGINGANGTSGTSGINGTNGIDGTSGINGANGTSGTSGINGANGIDGTSGINGANGTSGTSGINGANGIDGTSGINGVNGTSGINGANGIDGTSGINGANGTSGTSGINGANGTSGINGANGTSGINGGFGGNSFSFRYREPQQGEHINYEELTLYYDNPFNDYSDFGQVREIRISSISLEGDIATWLYSISGNYVSTVKIFSKTDNTKFAIYKINNVQTDIQQFNLMVSYVTSSYYNNFNEGEEIVLTYTEAGTSGTSGISGTSGTSGKNGTSGINGISGASGTSGISIGNGFKWLTYFSTNTAAPLDKTVKIWYNGNKNAASSIQRIYVDWNNTDGIYINSWLDNITSGDIVTICDAANPNTFIKLQITSTYQYGGYHRFYIILLSSNNHLGLDGNVESYLSVSKRGASGTSGTSGISPTVVTPCNVNTYRTYNTDGIIDLSNGYFTNTGITLINNPQAGDTYHIHMAFYLDSVFADYPNISLNIGSTRLHQLSRNNSTHFSNTSYIEVVLDWYLTIYSPTGTSNVNSNITGSINKNNSLGLLNLITNVYSYNGISTIDFSVDNKICIELWLTTANTKFILPCFIVQKII